MSLVSRFLCPVWLKAVVAIFVVVAPFHPCRQSYVAVVQGFTPDGARLKNGHHRPPPPTTTTSSTPRVGFSFSTGGLLLPYHLGVMDCLTHRNWLTKDTPIAGSSAGAIACASHACGIDSSKVLDSTIEISDRCLELGGARGRLLPMLREKLADMIAEEEFEAARERGNFAIAYRQVYPKFQAIHQTNFDSHQELHDAVCHSSTFPFFVTNWPVAIDRSDKQQGPRAFVDGYFAEPTARYGCPDFVKAGIDVDRTVTVCVFPQQSVGLTAVAPEDCISPAAEDLGQMARLFRLATQATSSKELFGVYESGYEDAERWCLQQQQNQEQEQNTNTMEESETALTL